MQWLNEFLTAYSRAVTNSGESAWFPFSTYRFYPLHYDLDLKRWDHVSATAKRKGATPQALATTIAGPLTIRTDLHFALHAGKVANEWEAERTKRVIEFLHELCQYRCPINEDRYGLYSAQIHNRDEIQALVQNTPWYAIANQRARSVGNLIMAAIHTAYAYYCDFCYLQWFEVLGPYNLPDGRKLIIRRFSNFQPTEVWPGPFASFRSLDILTVYRQADIVVDQWSHITSKENLAECLESAAVLMDGAWVEPEQWEKIMVELGQIAANVQNQWRALDFEQRKQGTTFKVRYGTNY